MGSNILETRSLPESHTSVNIANVLREAVTEWNLPPGPPIVTDNALNMTVVAEELGTSLHVGCLAHTLNPACGEALKITCESSPGQNEMSCGLFLQECYYSCNSQRKAEAFAITRIKAVSGCCNKVEFSTEHDK